MDAYDPKLAPPEFGLGNTGVICYINSFLQALASCTSFTRAVLQNEPYMRRTRTGAAVLEFVQAYSGAALAPDISGQSSRVLEALTADLGVRRPNVRVRFGGGMECASEALVHLLDMMEPPTAPVEDGAALAAQSAESPITQLFLHRFRCNLHCRTCKKIVSVETDNAVVFNLFHIDRMRDPPATVADFSKSVRTHAHVTTDYVCPACHEARRAAAAAQGRDPNTVEKLQTAACRIYDLTMIPEIIFCAFNAYVGYGGNRLPRYFPERIELPALDGGLLVFRLVAQIEHSGTIAGGHYWARCARAGDRVFLLNDQGVSKSAFTPTTYTYIVAYHYAGRVPPGPARLPAAPPSAPPPSAPAPGKAH
jgi:hypothetical protein